MSFVFRARRTGETGSGRKIVRGRRRAALPYRRPDSPPRSESPSWIFGATRKMASGAGKLLSSVFGSSNSPSTSEDTGSSYNSDDGYEDSDDRDEICSKGVEELNWNVTPQPIAQKSGAKLAIEQLILLETFSRDECDKLTKMIKSRVVEHPTMRRGEAAGQEVPANVHVGGASALPGSWRLPQTRKSPELFSSSARSLVARSPGTFAPQLYIPELRDTAITEAKKWLEEKKLESIPNRKHDFEPSTMDTATLTHVVEGELGSPVDMAKSYMQARPPWTSPTLSNLGFNTPSPNPMHLYRDEAPYSMTSNSLPSTRWLKRNSLTIGPSDFIDDTRMVRLKTVETITEPPVCTHIDLSTRLSENGEQNSSSADERVVLVSNLTIAASNENKDLEEAPHTKDLDKAPQAKDLEEAPQTKDFEEAQMTKDLKEASHAKDFKGVLETKDLEEAAETEDLEEAQNEDLEEAPQPKDLEEAQLTKDLDGVPQKKNLEAVPPSKVLEDTPQASNLEEAPLARGQVGHDSDLSEQHKDLVEKLSSETKLMHVEETTCTIPSGADDSIGLNDVYTSRLQIGSAVEEISKFESYCHSYQLSRLKETYSAAGPRSVGLNDEEEERNGFSKRVDANGSTSAQPSSFAGLNVDLHGRASINNQKKSSLGGLASSYVSESCELLSEASMDIPLNDEVVSREDGLQENATQSSEKSRKSKRRPNSSRGQVARGRSKGAQTRESSRGRASGK